MRLRTPAGIHWFCFMLETYTPKLDSCLVCKIATIKIIRFGFSLIIVFQYGTVAARCLALSPLFYNSPKLTGQVIRDCGVADPLYIYVLTLHRYMSQSYCNLVVHAAVYPAVFGVGYPAL